MSFSSDEELISEPVEPVAGSFNAEAMASGTPGVPMSFSWRGSDYGVARVLDSWKNLRPCHSGSGEQYVNKHFFKVETESGEVMTLYRARTGSKKDSWILYTKSRRIPAKGRETGPNGGERDRKPTQSVPIAVLVSGGGTNLQALIDAAETEGASCEYRIALVVADRECHATERARRHGIPVAHAVPPVGVSRAEARLAVSNRVLSLAREYGAEALVLAGFLTIMGGEVIDEYANRIINLHPALLPKFGGKGMWGHHVHEAVLASGDAESGCTVHLVDAGCDTGPILLQRRVPVLPGDTADSLASRISGEEHGAIVEGTRILARRLIAERAPGC